MNKCKHGLFFHLNKIGEDEKGLFRYWNCGHCGKLFKCRDLNKIHTYDYLFETYELKLEDINV